MKRKQKKTHHFKIITTLLILVVSTAIVFLFYQMWHENTLLNHALKNEQTTVTKQKQTLKTQSTQLEKQKKSISQYTSEHPFVPTLLISGSGGDASSLDVTADLLGAPKSSRMILKVDIANNNKLTSSGKISDTDSKPIVEFGTVKGTNSGATYLPALKVAIDYLVQNYQVTQINIIGFSSGATGAAYYMGTYGQVAGMPKVLKYASLNGEYNLKQPLAQGETLTDVLLNGPLVKTSMYNDIAAHAADFDPATKVLMLAANYLPDQQSDGSLPWSDNLSIYHLFAKNGNPISMSLYPTTAPHVDAKRDHYAIGLIKDFLYNDNDTQVTK